MKLQEHSITDEIADLINRLQQLEEQRAALLAKQRSLDADIIRHLASRKSKGQNDAEVRRDLGQFARNTLKLTRSVAASRTSAAIVAKTNPELISYVRRGEIGFTAIRAMEPYRELEGLLEAAVGKTRRQVEQAVSKMTSVSAANEDRPVSKRQERKQVARPLKRGRRRKPLKKSRAKRPKKVRQPRAKRPMAKKTV